MSSDNLEHLFQPECPLTLWNRIEQYFKRRYMPWLEKIFGRKELAPQDVEVSTIKRILIIRQHDMLGDFLLATPVLRALRERFPQAHLGVVTRTYFADTLLHHPYADEVLIVFEHGSEWTLSRAGTLWRQLRSGWDLTVVLNTVSHSLTSDLLAHASRARYVLGSAQRPFPGCSRNFFYNLIAPYDERQVKHQSERNLDIVRYIGVDTEDLSEVMRVSEAEREAAATRLETLGYRRGVPAIGIHVGAGKLMNRWPAERFAELAQRLHDQYRVQIVLFWGSKEVDLAERFCSHAGVEPIKVSPARLRELAAYFTHCDLLLCNDTGVMHIGAATGVPLLAIFGPTNPKEWKPVGDDFVAVQGKDGKIENVSVDQAYTALVSAFHTRLKSQANYRTLSVSSDQ